MTNGAADPDTIVAELRAAFDRSFARAPEEPERDFEELIAIRVGPHAMAVRVADVAGIHADRAVTRVPSPAPELVGITAFRGAIVPVYDLALLLGGARAEAPRFLVLAAGNSPVALAFDGFEGYLRVRTAELVPDNRRKALGRWVGAVARGPEGSRPVVDVRSLLGAIAGGASGG